jgi:hypothetical protein
MPQRVLRSLVALAGMAESFEFRLFWRKSRDGWFFVRFFAFFPSSGLPIHWHPGTMLARNSLCRFAALILLRKRKHLLPFRSKLPDRIDRAHGDRALSQFKTILSESRNLLGTPNTIRIASISASVGS